MTKAFPIALSGAQLDTVSLSDIHLVADERHQVDPAAVDLLTKDIDFQGLLQPILLVERPEGLRLVDGKHRLTSARALGWKTISANILSHDTTADQVNFARIMANIDRKKISKLERAEYLADLHETWQRLDPSARHGGDRRSANVRLAKERDAAEHDQSPIFGLEEWVAEAVGLKRAAFYLALKIVNGLTSNSKARIRTTWLEDHQAGLQLLAEQDTELQALICDKLFSTPLEAGNVPDAITLANGGTLNQQADKLYVRTLSNIERMPLSHKRGIVRKLKSVALEIAREEGWLK